MPDVGAQEAAQIKMCLIEKGYIFKPMSWKNGGGGERWASGFTFP